MPKETEIIYEVRSGGRVLAQFTTERRAKREMKRLRKEGMDVRVYSKWASVKAVKESKEPKKKSVRPRRASSKTRTGPQTRVNAWLESKGYKSVERDMTFQELYESVVVDLMTMEEAVGECSGRKKALIEGIVEAMDHPSITVRYIEGILEDTRKRRKAPAPSERWIDPMGWEVSQEAAIELQRCWQSLSEPFFLAAFRNGKPCKLEFRDSDLSVQPTGSGLALCYRELDGEKVYFVLKNIDWVEVRDDRVEIFGSLKDGSGAVRTFRFQKAERDSPRMNAPDFKEGWYLINRGFLVFVQASGEPLEKELRKDYDRYIDYSVVYPQFDAYTMTGGLIPYNDRIGISKFLKEEFEASDIDFIDVEGPWELRDAFENNDIRYLAKAVSRYPKLGVFRCSGKSDRGTPRTGNRSG